MPIQDQTPEAIAATALAFTQQLEQVSSDFYRSIRDQAWVDQKIMNIEEQFEEISPEQSKQDKTSPEDSNSTTLLSSESSASTQSHNISLTQNHMAIYAQISMHLKMLYSSPPTEKIILLRKIQRLLSNVPHEKDRDYKELPNPQNLTQNIADLLAFLEKSKGKSCIEEIQNLHKSISSFLSELTNDERSADIDACFTSAQSEEINVQKTRLSALQENITSALNQLEGEKRVSKHFSFAHELPSTFRACLTKLIDDLKNITKKHPGDISLRTEISFEKELKNYLHFLTLLIAAYKADEIEKKSRNLSTDDNKSISSFIENLVLPLLIQARLPNISDTTHLLKTSEWESVIKMLQEISLVLSTFSAQSKGISILSLNENELLALKIVIAQSDALLMRAQAMIRLLPQNTESSLAELAQFSEQSAIWIEQKASFCPSEKERKLLNDDIYFTYLIHHLFQSKFKISEIEYPQAASFKIATTQGNLSWQKQQIFLTHVKAMKLAFFQAARGLAEKTNLPTENYTHLVQHADNIERSIQRALSALPEIPLRTNRLKHLSLEINRLQENSEFKNSRYLSDIRSMTEYTLLKTAVSFKKYIRSIRLELSAGEEATPENLLLELDQAISKSKKMINEIITVFTTDDNGSRINFVKFLNVQTGKRLDHLKYIHNILMQLEDFISLLKNPEVFSNEEMQSTPIMDLIIIQQEINKLTPELTQLTQKYTEKQQKGDGFKDLALKEKLEWLTKIQVISTAVTQSIADIKARESLQESSPKNFRSLPTASNV